MLYRVESRQNFLLLPPPPGISSFLSLVTYLSLTPLHGAGEPPFLFLPIILHDVCYLPQVNLSIH